MTVSRIQLVAVVALLAACQNSPTTINYYTLAAPSNTTNNAKPNTTVLLAPIELAGFLSSSAMVMQLSDAEIQLSKQHLWAEDLNLAIAKYLQHRMQTDLELVLEHKDWHQATDSALRLRFDQFQATQAGVVIVSGVFQIKDDTGVSSQRFYYQETLASDGYTGAIAAMRIALNALSNDLAQALNAP